MGLTFDLLATDGLARRGRIHTARGVIDTPAFMPVGTAGTVKALYMDQVAATGAQIILGNTYHLMLRPGPERVQRLGGLHEFSGWKGPILTDSGGFQVWSLAGLRKMTEEGVTFKSHIDGSSHSLCPERSIAIQADCLGSDIVMVLDECTEHPASFERAKASAALSLRWAERCKSSFGQRADQSLFGILQGSTYPELRAAQARDLAAIGFDGYAIGGLAVGEGFEAMLATLDATTPHMPQDKPRYLMGVGKPIDLVEAVARGVDMFDCVLPTRAGRHGQAWCDGGPINLRNAQFAEDRMPLNEAINCPASRDYSKAYLHHLVRCGEFLGAMLLTWHNIAYYQDLMARMRGAISGGTFSTFAKAFREGAARG
jgi:queuine tRNA-ribosyltransferase